MNAPMVIWSHDWDFWYPDGRHECSDGEQCRCLDDDD